MDTEATNSYLHKGGIMGTKITHAGPRYVKTIEFVENLPAEESSFQEGEYQRLTESGKIESLRVKIEPYPDELTLVDEIGNDLCKVKTWLVPGRTGLVLTITKQIKVNTMSVLTTEEGVSIIGVQGETLGTDKLVERWWFYDFNNTFVCANIEIKDGRCVLDDALFNFLWKTTDDQEAAHKLEELRTVISNGRAKFVDEASSYVRISDGRLIEMNPKDKLVPPDDFDAAFYLKEYPDVAKHPYFKKHPYEHYFHCGKAEGRKAHDDSLNG